MIYLHVRNVYVIAT